MKKEFFIASVSFGKDSVAMLLMLIEKKWPLNEVVFYDTGMEFKAIYYVRDKVKEILDKHEIPLTILEPERPFLYDMLEKPVNGIKNEFHYGYGWCGGPCRWGTANKLKALDKYAKDREATVYVAIAADEPERLTRMDDYKRAPLAEMNVTEQQALEYCWKYGIHWMEDGIDLYTILDRVSCWCCKNKNWHELKNIRKYMPDYWERLLSLQDRVGEPMKKFRDYPGFGNLGDLRNLDRFLAYEEELESAQMSLFDLYPC